MKLSVAICTYNGARYLQEQLASISAQTRPPDELVVCDDCSGDETRAVLEAFRVEASFPVRLHFNEQNLGSAKNFEKAISLCEGEIIATCDQDDVWLPEKLRRTEKAFIAAPDAGLVFSDLEIVDENLRPKGYSAWQCWWVELDQNEKRLISGGRAFDVLTTRNVVTGAAMAFRSEFKELVLPIPQFSEDVIHDYWIALTISAVAGVIAIDEPLVKYRTHASQQEGLLCPLPATTNRQIATRKRSDYVIRHWLLEPVLERLSAREEPKYGAAVVSLSKRMEHLRARANFPSVSFGRRAPLILKELLASHYHLYRHPNENAWFDALKDFVPSKAHLMSGRVKRFLKLRRHPEKSERETDSSL